MDKRLQTFNEMTENDQVNGLYGINYSDKGQTVYSLDGELFDYDQPDFDEGDTYYSATVKDVDSTELVTEYMVYRIMEEVEDNLYCMVPEEVDVAESVSHDVKEIRNLLVDYYNQKGMINCFQVENIKEHVIGE